MSPIILTCSIHIASYLHKSSRVPTSYHGAHGQYTYRGVQLLSFGVFASAQDEQGLRCHRLAPILSWSRSKNMHSKVICVHDGIVFTHRRPGRQVQQQEEEGEEAAE